MASENNIFEGFEALEGLEAAELLTSPTALLGLGAVLLAPLLLPVVSQVAKPLAKALIKEGIVFYAKAQDSIAEASDLWGDWVAEAKHELAIEQTHTNAKSTQPPTLIVVSED